MVGSSTPSSDRALTECFAVTPVTPTLTTQAGTSPVLLGQPITDTAKLNGTANKHGTGGGGSDGSINGTGQQHAQGTITFKLYGPDDANPDIGDSAITETAGLGGFAMAAAPAIVRFVGGEVADALAASRRMYEITISEHPMYSIPVLDFRGTPCGIDVTKVVRTGILPQINTGMAGKVAGVGQVGAGLVTPPAEIFPKALAALAARAAR